MLYNAVNHEDAKVLLKYLFLRWANRAIQRSVYNFALFRVIRAFINGDLVNINSFILLCKETFAKRYVSLKNTVLNIANEI